MNFDKSETRQVVLSTFPFQNFLREGFNSKMADVDDIGGPEAGEPVIEVLYRVYHNGQCIRTARCDLSPDDPIDVCKDLLLQPFTNAAIPQAVRDAMVVCLVHDKTREVLSNNPTVQILGQAKHYGELVRTAYILLATPENLANMALPQGVNLTNLNIAPVN